MDEEKLLLDALARMAQETKERMKKEGLLDRPSLFFVFAVLPQHVMLFNLELLQQGKQGKVWARLTCELKEKTAVWGSLAYRDNDYLPYFYLRNTDQQHWTQA